MQFDLPVEPHGISNKNSWKNKKLAAGMHDYELRCSQFIQQKIQAYIATKREDSLADLPT